MRVYIASTGGAWSSSGGWALADRTLTNAQTSIYFPHLSGDATAAPVYKGTLSEGVGLPVTWGSADRFKVMADVGESGGWSAGETVAVSGIRANGQIESLGTFSGKGSLTVDGPYAYFRFVVSGATGDTDIKCDVFGLTDNLQ